MVKKLILDMDPGIDDALALLAACRSPKVELLGVSVVAGNLPLETVTANASGLLKLAGSTVQVYKGASAPLHGKLLDAADIHGSGGLGYYQVEPDPDRVSQLHAAQFIAETARAYPGEVTLVATGPLTNLAVALEYHLRDMENLAGIIFMGGAVTVPGNVTPVAEYNIYADPDAAQELFNSGLDLTMIGLDVTRKVYLDSRDLAALSGGGGFARAAAAMAKFYMEKYDQLPLHDPLALLAAIAPDLFQFKRLAVKVEVQGGISRGQTIADLDGAHKWARNIKSALSVKADLCREMLLDLWTRC